MNKNMDYNKIKLIRILILLTFSLLIALSSVKAQTKMWVNGYYAGWQQGQSNNGYLTTQNIDFSALTQIIHFSVVPNADGTLDAASNSITALNSSALISAAHAAGVKVIICIGGWNSESNFLSATSSASLNTFVNNIVSFMQSRGYDGIDIDWETLSSSDASQYSNFIIALRNALNKISPRPLLTAATAWQPGIFASLASDFDEINLMTYDLSGAWQGWVSWHNSPIYDGGVKFPSTGGSVPSINSMVSSFTSSGVPASKLGIGMDFYGYIWSGGSGTPTGGVTAPDQSWTTAPTVQSNVPYSQIMDQYYSSANDKWDSGAQAAYISIVDNSNSANDKFISYDNASTAQSKVNYVRNNGLGGMILWELGGGYRANMPAGQQQPLLEAVKAAVGGSVVSNPDTTPPTVSITSPSNGSVLSGTLNITANASDNVGVASVLFNVDGKQVGNTLSISPFLVSLNTGTLTNGSHTISAVAKDAAGNSAAASINVTISNSTVDNTPPVVSISSPANGSTVSGTVSITANATDNVGVANVAISIDGSQLGSTLTSSPYTVSCNTSSLTNGNHTFTAVAKDAAGNSSTASETVNVSNIISSTGNAYDLFVYQDNLSSNWSNSSWSITANFTSTQPVYSGTNAMKINQNAWGALRLLSGTWGSPNPIDPSKYQSLQFAIYGEGTGLNISVCFDGTTKGSFPVINYGSVPANQWTVITIPLTSLDPGNISIRDLVIEDVSGKNLTYDIDNLKFTVSSQTVVSSLSAPVLLSPSNSQTGVAVSSTLSWNAVTGASSYHVKVSADQTFATTILNTNGVAGTFLAVSGLNNNTVYYWEVSSVNSSGSETASQVWSFTTTGSSVTVTASLPVYTEGLASPWIDVSWSAVVNYANTQTVYQGTNSVQVNQNSWGGLSIHDGNWGSNNSINNSIYNAVQFAIYSKSALNINVMLENDASGSFPNYNYGNVPANTWTVVTIPFSQLNPNNSAAQRIDIMEMSGNNVTYYVDNISFINSSLANQAATNILPEVTQPKTFALEQNFPNPFNPSTTIQFTLASPSHVALNIYNILGQKVATLINEDMSEGIHSVDWNADNLPSGFYIYQLKAGNLNMIKKMELLK